jgi:hypothetical protein
MHYTPATRVRRGRKVTDQTVGAAGGPMAYGCEKTRRAAMTVRYAGVGVAGRAVTVATSISVDAGSAEGAIMQQAPRQVH